MVKTLLGTFVLVAAAGASILAVNRSQDIIDWWRLRDYTPSLAIQSLAANAGFSDYGDRLFYVHDPTLLNKESFAQRCTVGEETIVLGCYITNQHIYLFDVQDERLEGIEEVTAAHEMLHAAYDRLSDPERVRITALLQEVFDNLDNPRIVATVDAYRERDPSVVPNELHSILATEVSELPDSLEEHYAQYFVDRQKVVTLAEAYAEEFEKREQQIAEYDAQLTALETDIRALESSLSQQGSVLDAERTVLDSLINDPEQYNSRVDGYNALVRSYNTDVARLKALVSTYNQVVTDRNAIALEERELVDAIDTRIDEL